MCDEVNEVSILLGYDTMSTGKDPEPVTQQQCCISEEWKSQLHGCKNLKLCTLKHGNEYKV
jgi:hypothetical protein